MVWLTQSRLWYVFLNNISLFVETLSTNMPTGGSLSDFDWEAIPMPENDFEEHTLPDGQSACYYV